MAMVYKWCSSNSRILGETGRCVVSQARPGFEDEATDHGVQSDPFARRSGSAGSITLYHKKYHLRSYPIKGAAFSNHKPYIIHHKPCHLDPIIVIAALLSH
jgi:hypothetical protein